MILFLCAIITFILVILPEMYVDIQNDGEFIKREK